MDKLTWQTERRKVNDLKNYYKNPRQISEFQFNHLKQSLDEFNYVELIAIDKDNTILAGHMRVRALKSLGRGDEEIEVRVPNRKLIDEEVEEYVIRSNKNTGDWDDDILADQWEVQILLGCGFTKKELGLEEDEPKKGKSKAIFEFDDPAHLENYIAEIDKCAGNWGAKLSVRLPK
jgi:ParB-like chromosome segregation protein Spo0J